jgi:hypothetical protein
MDAHVRYPELFLEDETRTPRAYWTSLSYFNLYRIALATLFFAVTLIYGDALSIGAHALELFRYTALAYLAPRSRSRRCCAACTSASTCSSRSRSRSTSWRSP